MWRAAAERQRRRRDAGLRLAQVYQEFRKAGDDLGDGTNPVSPEEAQAQVKARMAAAQEAILPHVIEALWNARHAPLPFPCSGPLARPSLPACHPACQPAACRGATAAPIVVSLVCPGAQCAGHPDDYPTCCEQASA